MKEEITSKRKLVLAPSAIVGIIGFVLFAMILGISISIFGIPWIIGAIDSFDSWLISPVKEMKIWQALTIIIIIFLAILKR
jgi:hypothetical protein